MKKTLQNMYYKYIFYGIKSITPSIMSIQKVFLVCYLLLFLGGKCAEDKSIDYAVYSSIVEFSFSKAPYLYILVSDITDKNIYNRFSFENYKTIGWKEDEIAPIIEDDWQRFLFSINTSVIENYQLQSKFSSKTPLKLVSEDKYVGNSNLSDLIWPTVKGKPKYDAISGGLIRFSPVCVSKDRKRAVCALNHYQGPESGSTVMFFLENKANDHWVVVSTILVAIS
jgi:hypothetical protein